jgi:hypothetical protein
MDLSEQIRKKFAALSKGNASQIELLNDIISSWVIKIKDMYAIGIEVDESIKINESFSNISYFTHLFKIGNKEKYLLVLSSNNERLRNEFAGICAIFLENVLESGNKAEFQKNAIKWWENIKNLIGNEVVEKSVHSVLGELVTLYYLKKSECKNIKAENWTGPEGKSFDIQTEFMNYEVKSTIIKYKNTVTISSQYQLSSNNELSLIFAKFEEADGASLGKDVLCIDTILEKLAREDMDYGVLNNKVSKMGYKENSLIRRKKYRILELRKYHVDEDFPLINLSNLVNIRNKEHIVHISYKVDLTGLQFIPLDINKILSQ